VAAIGTDDKARLWKVATQQETGAAVTVGPGASRGALAFSPDGKTFATVGANGTAALWSVATQRRTGTLMTGDAQGSSGTPTAEGSPVAAVAFSPDGTALATASASDGSSSIRLWDTATQQEIGTPMTAGPGPVYAVAFSPDGTTLASADDDGSARLWDAATQQEIGAPMTAGPGPVYAVAFSPDGTTLVTADANDSSGGSARQWDVAFPAGLLTAACAIADQSLTRQQWADYAGTQPFQQVCSAS
jgi:WD40 repeat protein